MSLTGASKGMGKSMATALAQHGGTIIISSRKIDVLKKTAEEINEIIGEERVFLSRQQLDGEIRD